MSTPNPQPRPARPLLEYNSRLPPLLLAGETVLWEGWPAPVDPKSCRPAQAIWILALLGLAVLSAWAWNYGYRRLLWAGLITDGLVLCLLPAVVWPDRIAPLSRRSRAEPRRAECFRVTDRRIVRIDEQPQRSVTAVRLDELQHVTAEIDRRGEVRVYFSGRGGATQFERLRDWPALARVIHGLRTGAVRARQRARARRRRDPAGAITPDKRASSMIDLPTHDLTERATKLPPAAAGMLPGEMLAELAMQDGEQLLWTGRPCVREPHDSDWLRRRLGLIGWLMIPTAVLVVRFAGIGQDYFSPNFVLVGIAIIWLAFGLHALLFQPSVNARRRARTSYVLTSERAIVAEISPRRRRVESVFLDHLSSVSFDERPSGVGNVLTGHGVTFRMIDSPRQVHARLLQAVHAARGEAC